MKRKWSSAVLVLFLGTCPMLPGQAPDKPANRRLTEIHHTDTHFTFKPFKTLKEWEARKGQLRDQILFAAGLMPMPAKTALSPLIFGRLERKGYSIEKVAIQTRPGYWLAGNLYRPLGKSGRHPAVVSPHGHWQYGRLAHDERASVPARSIQLARLGYVVFSYDMVGFTDSTQTPHAFGDARDQLWGWGPLGLQLWNSMRAVDFLEGLPDVDGAKIVATGASGGATQVILLSAVDERIRSTVPVNMISAIMQGGSPCENAPGLRIGTNNMEIGAMMAPRPMLMISASGDWTRNTPREEFPALRQIWRLYGAEDRLQAVQIDAPHNYNQASREAMYRFFTQGPFSGGSSAPEREEGIQVEKLGDMMVWEGRTLPAGSKSYEQIREEFIEEARSLVVNSSAADKRRFLKLALHLESGEVDADRHGDSVTLTRTGAGDQVRGKLLNPGTDKSTVAIIAFEMPKAAASQGEAVLVLQPFGAKQAADVKHFLTFNKTDAAEQVQDILTAASWLRKDGAREIRVRPTSATAVAAALASAIDGEIVLEGPIPPFRGTDDEFIRSFFVPGLQKAGGWKSVEQLWKRGQP